MSAPTNQDGTDKINQKEINKMKEILNRFKSWAVWVSIGALIVFCTKEFAGIDISSTVNGLLDVLLPLLVAFGIVNNPTDKNHF
jgi:uncharacterized membrane protein